MDRRKTGIIAVTVTGVVAASAALMLSIPTSATMVQADDAAALAAVEAAVVEPTDLWGTFYPMPEGHVAFYISTDTTMKHYGDAEEIDETLLEQIEAQLRAAPARSAMIVDTGSLDSEGLTTIMTTVTPTNGMKIANSNEEMQAWLKGLFPGIEGALTSLPIDHVANASLAYTHIGSDAEWTVTESVLQYGDATLSVRVSTTDTTGETAAAIDAMLQSTTRP